MPTYKHFLQSFKQYELCFTQCKVIQFYIITMNNYCKDIFFTHRTTKEKHCKAIWTAPICADSTKTPPVVENIKF